jgi:MFS transporter, SHS family, lactate transporter
MSSAMGAISNVVSDLVEQGRGLNRDQRNAFFAAWLGWAMDAFDYFILVFVVADVAKEFKTNVTAVAFATTLTLAARPLGAYLFGIWADKVGRRIPLMVDVLFYAAIEFATGFSNSLTMLLALRFLYGIGMGGEWGLGASLAMEKIPPEKRGLFSGILQQGYPVGYLLAAVAFFAIHPFFGWRGLFFVGAIPALLALFVRLAVGESEPWERTNQRMRVTRTTLSQVFFNRATLLRFVYLVILMTAFNFMSHGTQDLYPTFLALQHQATANQAVLIAVIYNIGAILGGSLIAGLSQRFGRRRMIIIAAALALPFVPLFSLPSSLVWLAVGAFLIQFFVQGAWGIIPAHLTELSPDEIRGFYPGVTYQLGNLFAALNLPLQTMIAGPAKNFGLGLAVVTAPVILAVIVITALGTEARGIPFGERSAVVEGPPAAGAS